MEYFRILNLKREPFSNSPEPDLFYLSTQHLACLQQLELAIRLHRGLNVVIGDVGTGKTTLCRQLITKFAQADEGGEKIDTHLLMDPSFESPREFLCVVAESLGLVIDDQDESERQIKERIKHCLYDCCVDQKQTIVLIIDEGQKLPDFCLEILREFLNYETNQMKLLQIVIFAQKEFQDILEKLANFKDRVNRFFFLYPLSLRETMQMIAYRLARASERDSAPKLFSLSGLLGLYYYTGGYPRKIITLCHQAILSLIIQNKARADFFLIRSCARRVPVEKDFFLHYRRALLATVAAIIIVSGLWIYGGDRDGDASVAGNGSKITAAENRLAAGAANIFSGLFWKSTLADGKALLQERPVTLGALRIAQGDTLHRILQEVYGQYDEGLIHDFLKLNAHITDVKRLQQGDTVKIPAVPARKNPFRRNAYFVRVSAKQSLSDALDYIRLYPQAASDVRLLPYWNQEEGTVFAVIMAKPFESYAAAMSEVKNGTKTSGLTAAKVIRNWREGTEFYVR